MTRGALNNIRIVDLSWVVAGPMATKMLAGMGAEVIKIESSLRPEFTNRGHMFPALNNSKRSVSINLTTEEGRALIRDLVRISDIVVENFSGRVLSKYGLDYESMRRIKPDLIYVSASGVGRTGPQKEMLAYGTLLQAYSGRASLLGEPNPRLERMGILPAWTDPVTAFWEILAILSALAHRQVTSEGAYIDQSMLESTVSLLPESLLNEALGGTGDITTGNHELDAAPSGCFPCGGDDQWLALSVRSDDEWQQFCALIDRRDLAEDPAFRTKDGRCAARAELDRIAADWLQDKDANVAESLLMRSGIFAARSRNILDLLADPLIASRDVFPRVSPSRRTIGMPWMEGGKRPGDFTESPALGADNDYVLQEILGLSQPKIDDLISRGIVK
ncbi:CaiB/BaiF CoA transferase family protein [Shinella sp. BYT-45]|uniref:CaiB/BaiF CoA transferase family protein n=1 Tax=Shinella sp. BYT-45 TaxID=3377377 RepID=UPI00397EB4D2